MTSWTPEELQSIGSTDDEALNDRIDAAYRAKYAQSPYLPPMLTSQVRAATVRVDPR
jgi:hypothetical protein